MAQVGRHSAGEATRAGQLPADKVPDAGQTHADQVCPASSVGKDAHAVTAWPRVSDLAQEQVFLPVGQEGTMTPSGPLVGERGPFVAAVGQLQADVLTWLRGDSIFQHRAGAIKASPEGGAGRRAENGHKLEIGLLPKSGKRKTVNGVRCDVPFERLQQWVLAFKGVNALQFQNLTHSLHAGLASLDPDELSANGRHLRDGQSRDWAFELGVMQIMQPGVRLDPIHFDGGASLLLMGIALAGSRITHLVHSGPAAFSSKTAKREDEASAWDQDRARKVLAEVLPGSKVASIRSIPGTVYVASMTSPQHLVEHIGSETDLLDVDGFGPSSVVIILRCSVYRHSRGCRAPNPKNVHEIALSVVNRWLSSMPLRLPTMQQMSPA